MLILPRAFIALALLIALPSFALARIPADPYDYPIRGAYLGVFVAGVMVVTLELFRFRFRSAAVKRGFRLTSFGFGLVLIVSLLLAGILTTFQAGWQGSLPALPVDTSLQHR